MLKDVAAGTKALLAALAAVIVIAAIALVLWRHASTEAAKSRLEQGQGRAVVDSAKDAVATQGQAQAREKASEDLTSSNAKEIRNAEGADQPVPAAVAAAGRDGLCKRAAYRGSQYCLQRAAPGGVAPGR